MSLSVPECRLALQKTQNRSQAFGNMSHSIDNKRLPTSRSDKHWTWSTSNRHVVKLLYSDNNGDFSTQS
jgi:hypothetical protein